MIINNLLSPILINPIKHGASELLIVSGYASATMAYKHLEALKNMRLSAKVKLIIGMTERDGISRSNHMAFKRLVEKDYKTKFECRYIFKSPAVHSKVYTWLKKKDPFIGFVGSANYTQNGFGLQRECMEVNDPIEGLNYYSSLIQDSIDCVDDNIESVIDVYDDVKGFTRKGIGKSKRSKMDKNFKIDLPSVTVSILDKKGSMPEVSGLNWGQRDKREKNQAYIRLDSNIYKTKFFPPVGVRFTILSDDNEIFVSTRAQQNGKAIHTPENNSIFGKYFRRRLNVPLGQAITLANMLKYGRTNITFYKIDDESFFMDFSKQN